MIGMTSDDEIFAAITDERRQLATILGEFTPDQWATPSLCDAWSVRDVAAHLVVPLIVPMWRFGVAMAIARGDFDRANRSMTQRVVRAHGDRIPELLALHAEKRFTPPGHGPAAPLTDVIVHGQDILRPLRLTKPIAEDRLRAVLDYTAGNAGSAAGPLSDLTFRWEATDLDWSHGTGAAVRGPALALALILTGRTGALTDTTGEGAAQLAAHAQHGPGRHAL